MTTFNKMLQAKIEEAEKTAAQLKQESLMELLDNKSFIETQRAINAKERELRMLNTKAHQLNQIQPFIANDGSKYRINIYPINFFGHGLGEVLGIVAGSRSAFTDELMLQFTAISGISEIELSEARDALGAPAYCGKDGTVNPAIEGNLPKLNEILTSISIKLGLSEYDLHLTADRYALWFAKAEVAAHKKAADFNKNAVLDTAKFTMEE